VLLRDLAIVMGIAAAATFLCHWFRQPVVIGYLLAGFIIGPYTPPFSLVKDIHSIHTMAELGLVFLMFALGLEFSLPKLRRVGYAATLAASFEVLGMLGIGYLLGRLFGWSQGNSIFLGAILSMSSTTIIVKVFMDMKLLKEDFAQVVFGILILEDIVAVLILSVLSGLGDGGDAKVELLVRSMFKIGFFIILFLVFGLLIVPRVLKWVARFQVREMMGILALALCLGGALLAASFGFSVALGAFLIGAVIAASKEIVQITEWMHPVRDMFSAIFFVSAGMLIEPQILWEYKWPILIISIATLVGKIITDSAGAFLAGLNLKTSFKIGVSLGQIGEFSFVIASLGASLKLTSDFFFPLAVAVSSLTTLCTPYLIRNADGIVDIFMKATPVPVLKTLNSYQAWLLKPSGSGGKLSATRVFSRYLVRMLVYVAVLIGVLMLTQGVARIVPYAVPSADPRPLQFIILAVCAFVTLPLFMATAKYGNHVLLLLVTMSPTMLRIMNVRYFYNVTLTSLFSMLGTVYLLCVNSFLFSWLYSCSLVTLVILCGLLGRRKISSATEAMEGLLDEVLGLATSEPTRQAILTVEKTSFLHGISEPIALSEDSPSIQKSLRSLHLREQTGVSVVAIYRDGEHIPNPSPDTSLLPNDILLVVGNEEERRKAKDILLGSGNQ
ncbi:MAG: cation:proton antiporter, partial [Victivallales bacterium]